MGQIFIPHNRTDLLLWDNTNDNYKTALGATPELDVWLTENFRFEWSLDIQNHSRLLDNSLPKIEFENPPFMARMRVTVVSGIDTVTNTMTFSVKHTVAILNGDDRDLTLFKLFWL